MRRSSIPFWKKFSRALGSPITLPSTPLFLFTNPAALSSSNVPAPAIEAINIGTIAAANIGPDKEFLIAATIEYLKSPAGRF